MEAIKLFVDDERTPHDHTWILARDARQAIDYFRDESNLDIEQLSLDWYLGHGPNGVHVAQEILSRSFYYDLPHFKQTKVIWLHSSDRDMAVKQAGLFETARKEGLINPACRIRLNLNCRRRV